MTEKPTFITAERIRRDLQARREGRPDLVVDAEIVDIAAYLERRAQRTSTPTPARRSS